MKVLMVNRITKKNVMASFHGWGSIVSLLVNPLLGGSLLFPTKFAKIAGAHFINFRTMKG